AADTDVACDPLEVTETRHVVVDRQHFKHGSPQRIAHRVLHARSRRLQPFQGQIPKKALMRRRASRSTPPRRQLRATSHSTRSTAPREPPACACSLYPTATFRLPSAERRPARGTRSGATKPAIALKQVQGTTADIKRLKLLDILDLHHEHANE